MAVIKRTSWSVSKSIIPNRHFASKWKNPLATRKKTHKTLKATVTWLQGITNGIKCESNAVTWLRCEPVRLKQLWNRVIGSFCGIRCNFERCDRLLSWGLSVPKLRVYLPLEEKVYGTNKLWPVKTGWWTIRWTSTDHNFVNHCPWGPLLVCGKSGFGNMGFLSPVPR